MLLLLVPSFESLSVVVLDEAFIEEYDDDDDKSIVSETPYPAKAERNIAKITFCAIVFLLCFSSSPLLLSLLLPLPDEERRSPFDFRRRDIVTMVRFLIQLLGFDASIIVTEIPR